MRNTQSILIVGGAGYIGSHVNHYLQKNGHSTIVLDNLSRGFKEAVVEGELIVGDLNDKKLLKSIFEKYDISAVMHFSSFIDVGQSVSDPMLYYQNNVVNTLNLLDAMVEHNVKKLVFSSSAAVYGIPEKLPISENAFLQPINPYGKTKWIVEEILKDYDRAYGLRSIALRYFNAAGGDPDGVVPYFKRKETNLIPIILNSLLKNGSKNIEVYGDDYPTKDGSCIRDYIHVEDLAKAHRLSLKKLLSNGESAVYNLGNGDGFSVFEVIRASEKITGQKLDVRIGKRRNGDPSSLVADASKANIELEWKPQHPSLEKMIEDAWHARKKFL